jgi:hypothetical protein
MVSIVEAVKARFPDADPRRDFAVQWVGGVGGGAESISHWDTATLGPMPSRSDLSAWSLLIPPAPDWPQFKRLALTHPGLNAAMAAALPLAPAAALALPAALMQAEQGATADFRGCWRALAAAAPVAAETVAELVALAEKCQLPADFVSALSPE